VICAGKGLSREGGGEGYRLYYMAFFVFFFLLFPLLSLSPYPTFSFHARPGHDFNLGGIFTHFMGLKKCVREISQLGRVSCGK
jgi:hypothetical protein